MNFMSLEKAMSIVYSLALQNALDPGRIDPELLEEALRQQNALGVVHDFIVNELGED